MSPTFSPKTPFVNSKLQPFGTSIFAEMSALAVRTGAINLGQGFPDTDGHPRVAEAAIEAIRTGRGNQYPPGPGIPELRAAVAKHQNDYYGLSVDPDGGVLVTAGATEALSAAMLAILSEGDECIVFEPFYDSYPAAIAMAGAKHVSVTLRAPSFSIDIDELRAAITPRTKMILLNSPHNPTGSVLDRETLQAVAAVAIEHDLLVVSDEAYEHLTFDGVSHVPIATLPGMWERTITVGSAGKTFSFTGWKVGWATGPAELVHAVRMAKQFLTYVSAGPFQYAVAEGFTLGREYFDAFAADLQSKRDRLATGLAAAGFEVFMPRGTYFITTDIRSLGESDGLAFCRTLPERCGMVAVPNVVFYDSKEIGSPYVRFAFCKKHEVIDEAISRLGTLIS
jgi:N-succinyldiaminopimelate aminotransferase